MTGDNLPWIDLEMRERPLGLNLSINCISAYYVKLKGCLCSFMISQGWPYDRTKVLYKTLQKPGQKFKEIGYLENKDCMHSNR